MFVKVDCVVEFLSVATKCGLKQAVVEKLTALELDTAEALALSVVPAQLEAFVAKLLAAPGASECTPELAAKPQ